MSAGLSHGRNGQLYRRTGAVDRSGFGVSHEGRVVDRVGRAAGTAGGVTGGRVTGHNAEAVGETADGVVGGCLVPDPKTSCQTATNSANSAELVSGMRLVRGGLNVLLEVNLDRLPAAALLEFYQDTIQLADRFVILSQRLLAVVADCQATKTVAGVSTGDWVAETQGVTGRQGAKQVSQAEQITARPQLVAAGLAGGLSVDKTIAVANTLDQLPKNLSVTQRTTAEQHLLAEAGSKSVAQINSSLPKLLQTVAPNLDRETRLQQQQERAFKNRYLAFKDRLDGTTSIHGLLPTREALTFFEQLKAFRQLQILADKTYPDTPTMGQRYADALIKMGNHATTKNTSTSLGPNKPHIIITFRHTHLPTHTKTNSGAGTRIDVDAGASIDTRADTCVGAGAGTSAGTDTGLSNLAANTKVIGYDGIELSTKDLRLICCDCNISRIILGTNSEILDVGREHRLVTKTIRQALTYRDQGCIFPDCDTKADDCHAHHIRPWMNGGETKLDNLALLCPYHHTLIEPTQTNPWQIRIDPDGKPSLKRPRTNTNPKPQWERHKRHQSQTKGQLRRKPAGTAPHCPKPQAKG